MKRLRSLAVTAIACLVLALLGVEPLWVYAGVGFVCAMVVP